MILGLALVFGVLAAFAALQAFWRSDDWHRERERQGRLWEERHPYITAVVHPPRHRHVSLGDDQLRQEAFLTWCSLAPSCTQPGGSSKVRTLCQTIAVSAAFEAARRLTSESKFQEALEKHLWIHPSLSGD
jgi:hypothetical protein